MVVAEIVVVVDVVVVVAVLITSTVTKETTITKHARLLLVYIETPPSLALLCVIHRFLRNSAASPTC